MRLTRITDRKHKRTLMRKGGMVFSRVCPVGDGLVLYLTDGEHNPHYYVIELDKDETAKVYGTLESKFLHHSKQQEPADVGWLDSILGLATSGWPPRKTVVDKAAPRERRGCRKKC